MSNGLPEAAQSISPRQAAWMLGLTTASLVLLSLFGETTRLALRYDRQAVLAGEYWRLLTGHLVHGTPLHLVLNILGLALIAALFPRSYSLKAWLLIAAASVLAIDVGFVFYEPQLTWYVGLSGVLHGAIAAGAVAWWQHESTLRALALSVIVAGKLGWEQWRGALPLSGDLPVVVDAHLYGALGGLVVALVLTFGMRRRWSSAR